MQLQLIMSFKGDSKEYAYLKSNSYYFKELNRGIKDFKNFANDMKVKYKERTTDKLNSAIDNIDLISSVLEVLK